MSGPEVPARNAMQRLFCSLSALLLAAGPLAAAPKQRPAQRAAPKPAAPAPAVTRAETGLPVISTGKETLLVDHLKPEAPTVVLFYQPANPDDVDFEGALRRRCEQDPRVGLRLVRLPSLDAPIGKQYEVESTPDRKSVV